MGIPNPQVSRTYLTLVEIGALGLEDTGGLSYKVAFWGSGIPLCPT